MNSFFRQDYFLYFLALLKEVAHQFGQLVDRHKISFGFNYLLVW
ncbi:hypothetical protein [Pedobacter ginsenosidimutans]|nr:hypothetical protein [Pedobacter ginsenosidimutans]